ncbi:MAG: GTPase Obg [Candidatus Campbellbacteria bacterium]
MAFIDELHLHLKAGRGGDGVVRWLHLKGKEFSGAAGGNGGRGGDVVVEAIRDLSVLERYMDQKNYDAEDGAPGGGRSKEGRNGEDFILQVPVGSIVTRRDTGQTWELLADGQRETILVGGNGGYGNEHFKGSRNVTPLQSTKGKPGEETDVDIELQLVVDAGFIGMPNAGKSSLLNALTGAHAKVGAYAFTTLNPSLGVLYGYVLADIPGLIEGASEGRGLGHKFLRHIKRTKMVVHCISLEHEDPADAYTTVRRELSKYSSELSDKSEVVLLTKTDLLQPEEVQERKKEFSARAGIPQDRILTVSIYDDASLKDLSDELSRRMGELEGR